MEQSMRTVSFLGVPALIFARVLWVLSLIIVLGVFAVPTFVIGTAMSVFGE